jgi:extracellular elastinolytic metalloproteinase
LLRPELQDGQVVMSHAASPSVTLQSLEDIHASNCLFVDLPYFMENRRSHETPDSRHALLNFMVAATPNSEVAEDILARYDEHLAAMTSEFETGILGNYPVTIEKVRNVPDTVNPVKVQMAYVQVPHGDRTELTLVWKACYISFGFVLQYLML